MSGTASLPTRAVGSSPRSTWGRRHAKLGIILAGGAAVIVTGVVLRESQPKVEMKPPESAALLPANYESVAAAPPAVVLATAKAPAIVTTAPAIVAQAPAEKPVPTLVVTSFRRSTGQPPEYLKPKQAVAAAPTVDPTVSGIAYKGDAFEGTSAFKLRNAALVLPQWTTIPCVLETGVITGVSGTNPFRCRLKEDVKSSEGVTLMEQGTVVGGTYQSLVGEGQERIVAVTANARTPNGIVVPLGGPVADEIGAAGAAGTVENHWGRRIGGALLLSMLDAATRLGSSALQSSNGNGNSNINIGGSLQGGPFSQVTQSLLERQMSIPPTITLKQGTVVLLWTTRWITFDKVYTLETVR